MLEKLAQAALWLDQNGMFREADQLTSVMLKYAENELWEEDEDNDPVDPILFDPKIIYPELQENVLDLRNPDVVNNIRHYNPEFHNELQQLIDYQAANKKAKESEGNWGQYKIHYPKGVKLRSTDVANLFLTPEQQQINKENFLNQLNKATHGGTKRRTFKIISPSTNSENYERTLIADPRLEKMLTFSENDAPYAKMFDPHLIRSMFDPTYEEADPKMREKMREGDLTHNVGWLLRRINPNAVLQSEIVPGKHKYLKVR